MTTGSTGTEPVLAVHDLEVHYDKVRAVAGVSLTVRPGAIATIVGSNGAGKTTILKTIIGMLAATGGRILFQGEDIGGLEVDEIVVRGISLVPEGRRLFGGMTVRENLEIGAYRRTDGDGVRRDFDRVLGYFPMLAERLDSRAMSLSGGQQQMLAVARALMSAPRLLLLDEPSIGLAPTVVQTIEQIIHTIHADGVDILLVEQNAHMALELSQDAYVLETGEIRMSGPAAELAADDAVRRAYLGM
jgi:branched-chain amino acid transport system ATP-binding protein